jgi:hypothetical protein
MNQQSGMGAILWLARREISRLRVPYVLTVAFMLVAGVGAGSIVQAGAVGPANDFGARGAILADIIILLMATLLVSNYACWGSYSEWMTSSERKLAFMRALPIPVSTLVGSRMVAMLFALPFTVPAFFAPIYLMNDFRMGVSTYLAFILFWIGYAFFWAGVNLYLDVVLGSRPFFWISSVLAAAMLGFIVLIGGGLGIRFVYEVERLVSNYGLLAVPAALIAGVAFFIAAGRLTVTGLQGREIPV